MKRSPLKRLAGLARGDKPLERRTPLEQGAPLERRTALQPGEKGLERSQRLQARPKPSRAPDEARMSASWYAATLEASKGRCAVCGSKRGVQAHHVVPKQKLKAIARSRGIAPMLLVWDDGARNGLPLCEPCHARHESGFRRVRRRELREANVAFASDLGLDWYIERTYPS